MNSANCQDYDNCVQSELEYLYQPVDEKSLYANRFYDNQVAQTVCYNNQFNEINQDPDFEEHIEELEGFNKDKRYKNDNMFMKFLCFLISLVAIIFAVILQCGAIRTNLH